MRENCQVVSSQRADAESEESRHQETLLRKNRGKEKKRSKCQEKRKMEHNDGAGAVLRLIAPRAITRKLGRTLA